MALTLNFFVVVHKAACHTHRPHKKRMLKNKQTNKTKNQEGDFVTKPIRFIVQAERRVQGLGKTNICFKRHTYIVFLLGTGVGVGGWAREREVVMMTVMSELVS